MKIRKGLASKFEDNREQEVEEDPNMEAFDDDEDSENLDHFERDGFIVSDDDAEEDENDQVLKGKKTNKKKRKWRSVKDLVLDDDDIELLQENRISGIGRFPKATEKFKRLRKDGKRTKVVEQPGLSDDEGLLFDDIFEDEEASFSCEKYDMTDFIVDDERSYGEASMRWLKNNRKKLDQVVTICSYSLDDEGPTTDNANDALNHRKQVQASKRNPDNSSEFEPFFLVNKYTTERDDLVGGTDIPERMQMIEEIVGPPPLDKRSIEEETAWILNQLVTNSYLLLYKKIPAEVSVLLNKIKKEDIMKFLELHHLQKFDVPFIAMYRKEQCPSLLDDLAQNEAENEDNDYVGQAGKLKWHRVLWVVKELDKMWLLLQKRKSVLQTHQRKIYDEECPNIDNSDRYALNKQLFESISKSLIEAQTKEEVVDVDAKFSLHFLSDKEKMDGKFKRPIRKSLYGNCMKAGLWKLASQFRYASEQLSLQIALEKMDIEFRDYPDESPEEMALNFTCAMFETPELVLKGARHMAALELSCEPCIKKHIRRIFRDEAVVSTIPTPKGNVTIDSFHQFSRIKWLRNKPLSEFNDTQWLLIQKAEEEKLLEVSITLPESTLNKLIAGFNDAYLIDGAGRSAQLWKEQYKLIMHDAFSNFLLPSMEKEARDCLTTRAKHWLLMECGKELWKMVSVGPYSCNVNISGSVESVFPKVMACCWGSGKPAITFVMLDPSGTLLDTLEARSFTLWSQNIDDVQRKKCDQQRVLKFMKIHQPDVIVIGATNASCIRLKDEVKEIVSNLEESLRELDQARNRISVVFGDESLPQLYEHSQISSDQLPEQPGIVKRAVALGRYLQNPLAMVATLCGDNREIVSWNLSSLDNFLTPDEKYEIIEQVTVDVTNQVGVDINFAVSNDWYRPLLQFVSGLGPQRASILQRETVQYRAVNSRKELASFGLKTEKVFHNAIGFLCVRSSQLPCTSLDGTRIHPESYELAESLAEAVCNNITEAPPIEYVKKEPQVLCTFDINNFSDNYEHENGANRRETIFHIKMEFLHGFLDPRKPYKAPSVDEDFNMICGKNGTAVAEGRFVQAIVRHVRPQQVFCALDSGLTGIIMKDGFSDEGDDCSFQNKLHEGDKILCRIKQIDKSKCQALLTCKQSEMKRNVYEDIHEVDPYYHVGEIIPLSKQQKSCVEEKLEEKHFMPRTISHPCFKNMTKDEAAKFLSDKDAGESIFHPSSRGTSYLTLTLKVFHELYVNKDIAESGKDHKDMTSFLHIGKALKIGDETFCDLEEVMDHYVIPLVTRLKEMLGFRKFKRGSTAEVDEVLRAEKAEYPLRIVYYFRVSHEHPGTFILSYIRTKNLHHEYIGLLPNGFRFRKQTFEKIEHLVGYFQKNVDALQPKSQALEGVETRNSSEAYTGDGRQGQFNYSEPVSVSRGRNHRDADGNEDVGKKHPSGIPRPHNAPNNGDQPGGWSSGGNWDKNDGNRNSEWSKNSGSKWGQSGDNGPQDYSASGWGSTKNGDSNGNDNDGGWPTGGNNGGQFGGRGGRHGHESRGGGRRRGNSGDSFDSNAGVWHASGNNAARRGRGGGQSHGWVGTEGSGGTASLNDVGGVCNATGNNSARNWHSGGGSFDSNDEAWNASGNNVGGRGGHGGSWGGSFDSNDEAWNASGNNVSGRGGHGGSWGGSFDSNEGAWPASGNNVGGRGGRGGSWGGKKKGGSSGGGFGSNEGAWRASGNNRSGRGGSWGGNKKGGSSGGSFGSNEGAWHASGNNVSGRESRGGSWGGSFDSNDEAWNASGNNAGERGGRGGSWGGSFDSNEGAWHASGNNARGRGGRGDSWGGSFDSNKGAWHASGNNASGCGGRGRGGSQDWGAKKASESRGAAGNNSSRDWHSGAGQGRGSSCAGWGGNNGGWNSTGNNTGEYGQSGGRGYGGRNGNSGGHRGGRRGGGRSGRGRGRGGDSGGWYKSSLKHKL